MFPNQQSIIHIHFSGRGTVINFPARALIEYSRFYDYSASYPEGEQGPGDDDEDDEEVEIDSLDDAGYELVLPSGARVGHRSLARYYRQSLNPDR